MSMHGDMIAEAHFYAQPIRTKDCGDCASCEWRNRWETQYQNYLNNNPEESAYAFINRNRKMDKKFLICQRRLGV